MSVNKAGDTGMRAAGYCLHSSQTPVVRLCKNMILRNYSEPCKLWQYGR